jgi:hypothetical protein
LQVDFEELINHDMSEECPICRAQEVVESALVPAAAAWEMHSELPKFAMALHGAAGLLGAMLQEGLPRDDVMVALNRALDDIEQQITEDRAFGGPTQGNA